MKYAISRLPLHSTSGRSLGLISAAIMTVCAWTSMNARSSELPPLEQAMAMIDTTTLHAVEGIWEYPGDDVRVMIWRDTAQKKGSYNITVLEAFDTRLETGQKLGWLTETAEKGVYTLNQYSRRKRDILDLPGSCRATLGNDGNSILVSNPSRIKISVNLLSVVPRFWRMLRLRPSDGSKDRPREGLVRIYPSDTKGTVRKEIIIL